MADRNFQKKKRNDVKRKRKPVMLITAEGRNKTEKQRDIAMKWWRDQQLVLLPELQHEHVPFADKEKALRYRQQGMISRKTVQNIA